MTRFQLPAVTLSLACLAAGGWPTAALAAAVPTAVTSTLTTYLGIDTAASGNVGGDPAQARSDFSARLTGVSTETFEGTGFVVNQPPVTPLTFAGSTGNILATLTGSTGFAQIRNLPYGSGNGRFNTTTGGSKYLELNSENSFTISFAGAISAFGFYGTDIGDFGGKLQLELFGVGPTALQTFDISLAGNPSGSLVFFGFVDTGMSYQSIRFTSLNTLDDDYFGFDDMVVGDLGQIAPIPEPGSFALLSAGLLALTAARRRRA